MLSKVLALSLVASAAAQSILSITSPGPNTWWVLNTTNTLAWSPCDPTTQALIPSFNAVVMNSNQQILSGNLSIAGAIPTFDCSFTITAPNVPASTGYTMFLTNASDTTQVLASTTFELKPPNSAFPTSASSSAGSSATSTGASATASAKSAAGATTVLNFQGLFAAVAGAGAVIGFF